MEDDKHVIDYQSPHGTPEKIVFVTGNWHALDLLIIWLRLRGCQYICIDNEKIWIAPEAHTLTPMG